MEEQKQDNGNGRNLGFESLDILIGRWKDGTFSEIIDDWKWIFSYSPHLSRDIVHWHQWP